MLPIVSETEFLHQNPLECTDSAVWAKVPFMSRVRAQEKLYFELHGPSSCQTDADWVAHLT